MLPASFSVIFRFWEAALKTQAALPVPAGTTFWQKLARNSATW